MYLFIYLFIYVFIYLFLSFFPIFIQGSPFFMYKYWKEINK